MEFGKKLRELRTSAGLTQLQLANLLGVTKSVVSFYELQERTPSPDVLIKLAGVFHVTTDYLLGLTPAKSLDVSGLEEDDVALLRMMAERMRRGKVDRPRTG